MDALTPEMKVLDAGEKYFRQLRLTAKDPRVSRSAADWEIFFGEKLAKLRAAVEQHDHELTASAA